MCRNGFIVSVAIACVGGLLQLCIGNINWNLLSWSVNVVILFVYLSLLITCGILAGSTRVMLWIRSADACVPALLITGVATMVYGITCISETLSLWPFVMLYAWLATIAGLVAIDTVVGLWKGMRNLKSMILLFVHLGFFIAVVCATLGYADMKRVSVEVGDDVVRPVANESMGIRLNGFRFDEYEPNLVVVSNRSGEVVSDDVGKWGVKVLRRYDFAGTDDGEEYVEWKHEGATVAALVSINGMEEEWVSNGSFMFAPRSITLNEDYTLMMPEGMPRRFVADVSIFANGYEYLTDAEIEVNKPFKINGWNIYLTGYDREMGRWSRTCVLELVKDPWQPFVYMGIFMLLAGAFLMIVKRCLLTSPCRGGSLSNIMWVIVLASVVVCACFFFPVMTAERRVPALQSPWFFPHIIMYMFCYAFFGAATLLSCLRSKITDGLVYVGLSLMTIGMLFGALWAKDAWGHYWSWDPKETWAAATWLLYLTYIHLRKGKPADGLHVCLLVLAFCCLQMCWWGINYLPAAQELSVHTYR